MPYRRGVRSLFALKGAGKNYCFPSRRSGWLSNFNLDFRKSLQSADPEHPRDVGLDREAFVDFAVLH